MSWVIKQCKQLNWIELNVFYAQLSKLNTSCNTNHLPFLIWNSSFFFFFFNTLGSNGKSHKAQLLCRGVSAMVQTVFGGNCFSVPQTPSPWKWVITPKLAYCALYLIYSGNIKTYAFRPSFKGSKKVLRTASPWPWQESISLLVNIHLCALELSLSAQGLIWNSLPTLTTFAAN